MVKTNHSFGSINIRFIIVLTQCLLYLIISTIYIEQYKPWKLLTSFLNICLFRDFKWTTTYDDYYYMIGGHAKVKVFLLEHDDYLDVFRKTVKDGWSAITRGWSRVVRAFCMEECTIWAFRFTLFSNQNVFHLFLYRL